MKCPGASFVPLCTNSFHLVDACSNKISMQLLCEINTKLLYTLSVNNVYMGKMYELVISIIDTVKTLYGYGHYIFTYSLQKSKTQILWRFEIKTEKSLRPKPDTCLAYKTHSVAMWTIDLVDRRCYILNKSDNRHIN